MLHITIISVGKLKEQYWKDAQAEYLKRLQIFVRIKILELKEEKFTQKDNPEIIKQKEAEKISNAIPKNTHVIILDKKGKQFSSEDLSKKLSHLTMEQYNNVTIIIGGPLGLAQSIVNITKDQWSFSNMTFTHQMVRIILLEQLYRGFMIIHGRNYHY